MARDVPYSGGGILRPPVLVEVPNVEVADEVQVATTNGKRGRQPLALALNGCYEQRAGALIPDYDPRGILTETGKTAYYRPKGVFGRGGLSKTARVYLYLTAEDAGDSDPDSAEVVVTTSAGTVSWTYADTGDIATVTRVLLGTVAWDDSSVFDDVEVEITSDGLDGDVAVSVFGVSVVPVREATGLPAGEYDNDVIPLDTGSYVGEAPVSTARLQDEHQLALDAYIRTGNVLQTSRPENTFQEWAVEATPPRDVTEVQIWVRTRSGLLTGELTVRNELESDAVGTTADTWYGFTFAVQPGVPTRIECFESDAGNLQLVSACAYWADADRPRSS